LADNSIFVQAIGQTRWCNFSVASRTSDSRSAAAADLVAKVLAQLRKAVRCSSASRVSSLTRSCIIRSTFSSASQFVLVPPHDLHCDGLALLEKLCFEGLQKFLNVLLDADFRGDDLLAGLSVPRSAAI